MKFKKMKFCNAYIKIQHDNTNHILQILMKITKKNTNYIPQIIDDNILYNSKILII